MAYWLFKTEPSAYSFADLLAEPGRTTGWDGVRNYQARNYLRDQVKVGDGVLFYHSGANPPAIVGIAEVVRAGHPDPTAFDPKAHHFDPKSDRDNPTWYRVAIKAVRAIDPPLGLPDLNRVAGQTVDHCHWHVIPRFTGDPLKWPWPQGAYNGDAMDQMRRRIEGELQADPAAAIH